MIPDHFNEEDKESLDSFLEELLDWAPSSLQAVVLYGSMARDDFGASSDMDLLVVFDEENPEGRTDEIVKIIGSVKPSREIRPVVTNLKDVGEDLIREVMREGIVLYGKLVLSPDDLALRSYRIVSYGLGNAGGTERTRIMRRIHGYSTTKEVDGKKREYEYEGLKDEENCHLLGKGVVAVPERDAEKFHRLSRTEQRECREQKSLSLEMEASLCV